MALVILGVGGGGRRYWFDTILFLTKRASSHPAQSDLVRQQHLQNFPRNWRPVMAFGQPVLTFLNPSPETMPRYAKQSLISPCSRLIVRLFGVSGGHY